MGDGQEIVDLHPVCLRFAADVLVEGQRAVDKWQLVVVDIRQPAEFAEKAARLELQVPWQRGRIERGLLHLRCGFACDRVGRGVEHHIALKERVDRRGRVQLHRALEYVPPSGASAARLARRLVVIGKDCLAHQPDGRIEDARHNLLLRLGHPVYLLLQLLHLLLHLCGGRLRLIRRSRGSSLRAAHLRLQLFNQLLLLLNRLFLLFQGFLKGFYAIVQGLGERA